MPENLVEKKIASAPTSSGVYLFKDVRNRIIYIGKGKNLRNRLKNYTGTASGLDMRKQKMIKTAIDISFIVTESEREALALEANLIKQNRPRYNVILRDDKNYPYIRIDMEEEWPRIEVVRRIRKDQALYFGPYIPAHGLKETLSFIRRFFNIRPCRYSLLQHMKPCVQYQMGRCPAPCGGLVSRKEYLKYVDEVLTFLRGKNKDLLNALRNQMNTFSRKRMYEEAARIRDRMHAIEKIWDSQNVVSPGLGEIDFIGLSTKETDTAIVQLFIRNGIMTGSKEFFLQNTSDMPEDELLHTFIEMLYSNQIIPATRIALPNKPSHTGILQEWLSEKRGSNVIIDVPRKGRKKKLVEMACKNAEIFLNQYKSPRFDSILLEIQKMLNLREKPQSIGAFDVSTIQGTGSIGAYILWEENHFQKDSYRYVNIKTVKEVDDYAMIEQTVRRVLKNVSDDIPNLIIIDGGKGQLDVVRRVFEEVDLPYYPEIIAIAKNPDRVFTAQLRKGILIDDGKAASLLLRSIRDEVHRFAVTRHRRARKRTMLTSILEQIPGVGKKRRLALLKHFGSLENIKKAPVEEISDMKGFTKSLANRIKESLSVE